MWLNIAGVWRQITIDDYYPTTRDGNFAFSKGKGGSLWVPMLEKAYAKGYRSYAAIHGGSGAEALRDLTGAPVVKYSAEYKNDPDGFWERLTTFDNKGYIMVAGKDLSSSGEAISGQSERKHHTGLISGHEYSLIAAKQTDSGPTAAPYGLLSCEASC